MREEIKAAVADCYEKLEIEWNVDVGLSLDHRFIRISV